MKRAELERLRALLRETDPAAGVDGPPSEPSARLRRTVLAALPEPGATPAWPGTRAWLDTRTWLGTRQWVLAACAVAVLMVGGTAVLRVLAGPPAEVEAARPPIQAPSPSALPSPEPRSVDGASAASSTATPEPRIATRAAGDSGRQRSAAATRPPLVAAAPAELEPLAAASTDVPSGDGDATAEVLAIAALPAPLGRQIQVTAPGGTRIVWILTPSTGP